MEWDNPVHVALNLVATALLAVVVALIMRAPAERLGRSRWARGGWVVFAVGLSGFLNGVYIPVGATVALRHLRQKTDERARLHP